MSDSPTVAEAYLVDLVRSYRNYKVLGERALAQISDADLHTLVDPDANSVAIVVRHVAGNLRSRFTDFLTSDGEKPDRNRDAEFEMLEPASRDQLMEWWQTGWQVTLDSIEGLTAADLERIVYIRGEPFLVIEALNRSISHTAYHIGQIVTLGRHFASSNWKILSVPRRASKQLAEEGPTVTV
jgi:hypothetical protein